MSDLCAPLSVLVVDDSADTANSMADMLLLAGCTARAALCGEEALRLAAADPPDVVLADIIMPRMDGCELVRRLAALPAVKPPLMIAVTGCGSEGERRRAAAAGFHIHLVKPVDPAVLIGLLRRVGRTLASTARTPEPYDDNDAVGHYPLRLCCHAMS